MKRKVNICYKTLRKVINIIFEKYCERGSLIKMKTSEASEELSKLMKILSAKEN